MSCLIIIPLIIIYDITPTIYILLVPLGVILAGVMGLAVGLMFAPFNCIQRDVEHLLRFVVRAGFFVSPVMWTAEMAMERGTFGELVLYNPMVTPITMVRHGFVGNSTGLPFMVIASSLFFIFAMWIIGTIVFNKYERNAVKYL
jgi:ABC-2 type transport system permease protein